MSESNHRPKRDGTHDGVFTKKVSAGRRTYFFDVKTTKSNDYYLTITESKRRMGDDGTPFYEKHKIFLYREDFEKFLEGINDCVSKVEELRAGAPETAEEETRPDKGESSGSSFTDVSFEDLK